MNVYKNGNTIVEIKENGTKIRYTPDNVLANPERPESIDLKVCNRCDVGCPQCHECSVPNGALGDLSNPLFNSLLPFTELAIGGGDPMTHPELENFLKKMQIKAVICNITVHWTSFLRNYEKLLEWSERKMIHGIGVSINEVVPCEVIDKLKLFKHAVVHSILGVAGEACFRQTMNENLNILLLGYKTFGRGALYKTGNDKTILENMAWINKNLSQFPSLYKTVAFDNLAIDQTDLKLKLNKDVYSKFYMGEDGTFTMYIDLPENKFAKSSCSAFGVF